MPAYTVRWEIEVDADDERQAVELAVEMLPVYGNDTTATEFQVTRSDRPAYVWDIFDIARDWR